MTRRTEFVPYRPKTILNKGRRADHLLSREVPQTCVRTMLGVPMSQAGTGDVSWE